MNGSSLYCGNLAYDVTEEELGKVFNAHGMVVRVSIPTDRGTGQPRGFGFVEMSTAAEAEAATAALDGTELNGRTLVVNEARPKAGGR